MRTIISSTLIASAGTRVQIQNTADDVLAISFHARPKNSGFTYVGTVTVASTTGWELQIDGLLTMRLGDAGPMESGSVKLDTFYVDGDTTNDIVDWVAIVNP